MSIVFYSVTVISSLNFQQSEFWQNILLNLFFLFIRSIALLWHEQSFCSLHCNNIIISIYAPPRHHNGIIFPKTLTLAKPKLLYTSYRFINYARSHPMCMLRRFVYMQMQWKQIERWTFYYLLIWCTGGCSKVTRLLMWSSSFIDLNARSHYIL